MFELSPNACRCAPAVRAALISIACAAVAARTAEAQGVARLSFGCGDPATAPVVRLVKVVPQIDARPGSIFANFQVFWSVRNDLTSALEAEEARVELRMPNGATLVGADSTNLLPSPEEIVPAGANRTALLRIPGPFPGTAGSFRVSVRARFVGCAEKISSGTVTIPEAAQVQGPDRVAGQRPPAGQTPAAGGRATTGRPPATGR